MVSWHSSSVRARLLRPRPTKQGTLPADQRHGTAAAWGRALLAQKTAHQGQRAPHFMDEDEGSSCSVSLLSNRVRDNHMLLLAPSSIPNAASTPPAPGKGQHLSDQDQHRHEGHRAEDHVHLHHDPSPPLSLSSSFEGLER